MRDDAHRTRRPPGRIRAHSRGIPGPPTGRGPCAASAAGPERGAVTLEFANATLVVMLVFLGFVVVAVWYHAQGQVITAAQDGARAAAAASGSVAAGQQRAAAILRTGLGVTAAANAAVEVERGADRTRVTVRVPLAPLLPVPGNLAVSATDEQLTERFTARSEQAAP